MRRLPLLSLALAALLSSACAGREKSGDKAAAVGDWKTAERAYADALAKDPDKAELKEKYRQARASALDEAIRKAEACWAARDVECAFQESDYALHLDAGNTAMATLRASASREAGMERVRRAGEAAARGDHRGALAFLASAREASGDPAVTAALQAASPPIVAGAVNEADRLRGQAQFPQAIDLLGLAVKVDPAVQGRLQATQAEYERWKDAEAERLARDGDRLLEGGRYGEAETSYRAALALRPQSRARPLAAYAGVMTRGESALQRKDYAAAEKAFVEAAQMNVDRGQAVAQLDRVRIRPYAIALRAVLVRPVRPDGRPWAGPRGRELDRVASWFDEATRGGATSGAAIDLAQRVPRDNQPVIVVNVAMPDGREAQTAPRRGAWALLDGSFTLVSNGFDDRQVSIRVVHDDGGGRPVDVGLVLVRLGDLVSSRKLILGNAAVAALQVEAVPADRPDGAIDRLTPVLDRDNLAPAWSNPAPGARGLQLVAVEASAPPGATPVSLFVEIEQGGAVVYRSPARRGSSERFTPAAVYLFARPDEGLGVSLLVDSGRGAQRVASATVTGRALESGIARVTGQAGGGVTLNLRPRQAGPAGAPGS